MRHFRRPRVNDRLKGGTNRRQITSRQISRSVRHNILCPRAGVSIVSSRRARAVPIAQRAALTFLFRHGTGLLPAAGDSAHSRNSCDDVRLLLADACRRLSARITNVHFTRGSQEGNHVQKVFSPNFSEHSGWCSAVAAAPCWRRRFRNLGSASSASPGLRPHRARPWPMRSAASPAGISIRPYRSA